MKKVVLATDGGCSRNPGYMSLGILLMEDGNVVKQITRKIGWGTNNQAECSALLEGIHQAKELGYTDIEAKTDSELLSNHYKGAYRLKNKELKEIHKQIKYAVKDFDSFKLSWHRRDTPLAQAADALTRGITDLSEFLV